MAAQKGDLITYFISFDNIFVREFRCRNARQRFYPRIPLFLGIFHIECMEVGWVFVKQLDPLRDYFLGSAVHPFQRRAKKSSSAPLLGAGD